ncbi:hypothetical protein VM1G_10898 [Cytospora mali]|uniref:non-specific serine/threonine protein kinase n=1 Tax=Cytospora mali TaxID=578113 RepID=A0A194VJH4_CYTMA|nr:hypothetical protein VM1G_10898 [Valsa mali]
MMDPSLFDIIQASPLGRSLELVHDLFKSTCEKKNISCCSTADALVQLSQEDLRQITSKLLGTLLSHPASEQLHGHDQEEKIINDIWSLRTKVLSNAFDFSRILPLLEAVLTNKADDKVWTEVYQATTVLTNKTNNEVDEAVPPSTPPPKPRHPAIATAQSQTPYTYNSGNSASTDELRKDMDRVIKGELRVMHADIPGFHERFFRVAGLEDISTKVLDKCQEGPNPLFCEEKGWTSWPQSAEQGPVSEWFINITSKLAAFAAEVDPTLKPQQMPVAQPNKELKGAGPAKRKVDVSFVNDTDCHWSNVIVPGELKKNPLADTPSQAYLDIARYAREVLAAQPTRRFVLSFTLCGSLMRIWEFDRLGAIASKRFNINQDALLFVLSILGFLFMNEEQLGLDSTFRTTKDGKMFLEIQRDGHNTERIIIDHLITRVPCIVGRATTCWKAHIQGSDLPLVIKDSWQYPQRDHEGEILSMVTEKVRHVARYYHHETVRIGGKDDDVLNNIRAGLSTTNAQATQLEGLTSCTSATEPSQQQWSGKSIGAGSRKRSSSQRGVTLPASKRARSTSKPADNSQPTDSPEPNREHRRVILRDYGEPIYKASTLSALLTALEGCIEGHESLYKAGLLHRDISINNLMINEDKKNPSWGSFLIDLDLAIKEPREKASGAQGRTGTKAFMAIGVLKGEQHSFTHDLESFFWVLFWICIHYESPGKGIVDESFEKWNYMGVDELIRNKMGVIASKDVFLWNARKFTDYCNPLIPWVEKLREVIIPGDKDHHQDEKLYSQMKDVLREASRQLAITPEEPGQ